MNPPEWTPPEWTPSPWAPGTPPQPERTAALPMLLTTAADEVRTQLLRRRIIVSTGPLDAAAAEDVVGQLLLLDTEGPGEITLHLSAPDADLAAALTVISTVDLIAAQVHAIATGSIESAAVGAYAAAARRSAHPHAAFVLRDPTAAFEGRTEDLAIAAEQHARDLAILSGRIAAATGQSPADVAADMARGRLLTAGDAEDYGLVTTGLASHP